MLRIIGLAAVLLIAGCAAISKLPTFEHCSEVRYERIGTAVSVDAKCTAGTSFQ